MALFNSSGQFSWEIRTDGLRSGKARSIQPALERMLCDTPVTESMMIYP